jgi:protein O-GlcNAc transferase
MPPASPLQKATVLTGQGRLPEAAGVLRGCLERTPGDAEALELLGRILAHLGREDEALAQARRAIDRAPSEERLYRVLGDWLTRAGRHAEASALYRQWTAACPGSCWAHNSLGMALVNAEEFVAAEEAFARAAALEPGRPEPGVNRVKVLLQIGRAREAAGAARETFRDNPGSLPALSLLPYCLNFVQGVPPGEVREAHEAFGRAVSRGAGTPAPFPNPREPERRLRVGLLSPDLREHSVAYFLKPLLRHLDRGAFELHAYAAFDELPPDAVTEDLKPFFAGWRTITGVRGPALAQLIRGDRIDVLIDLAGHTGGNRLETLALKPAPLIGTWLGYPATTGLQTVDFRVVDGTTDPAGAEAFSVESLARLPGCFLCYEGPGEAPAPAMPTAEAPLTFASFNMLAKMDDGVIEAWSRVLRENPGSRLLLKRAALSQEPVRRAIAARFEACGVEPLRLEFLPRVQGTSEHLALYSRVHIALDTFPYNGTTTTCEALWMGVPVVTLEGALHAGRVGATLLRTAGLPEWVAAHPGEYVRLASSLGADRARLAQLRETMRDTIRNSALCDAPAFAARFGAMLREQWRRWCGAERKGHP